MSSGIAGPRCPDDVPGHISLAEGRWLAEHASGLEVLEIGCFRGRSTAFIASTACAVIVCDAFCGQKNLRADQRKVDFDDVRRDWHANMVSLGFEKKTVLIPRRSDEGYDIIAQRFGRRFALVFVDGGHDYDAVRADVRFASLLLPGRAIAFHDYYDARYPDVRRIVDDWAHTAKPSPAIRVDRIAAFRL